MFSPSALRHSAAVPHTPGIKFRLTRAIVTSIVYLGVFAVLLADNPAVGVLALIYAAACMWVTRQWIRDADARRARKEIEFAQSGAPEALGIEWGSFHHVFYSEEPVVERFQVVLNESLKAKFGSAEMEEVVFKDIDRDLSSPETRTFLRSAAQPTARNTQVILLWGFSRTFNVQGVRWWILLSGIRDPNKLFRHYALSPFVVPTKLLPYLRRQYDPLSGLVTVYPGFFNAVDVVNRTRELQFVAFETLIEVLDAFGVDTADLKQQKGNVMNINVSGGQTNFGALVQGGRNKVSGVGGGARA